MLVSDMTLEEARSLVKANIDKGIRCPCCTQFAKVYKRKLNSAMARSLIYLSHRVSIDEWVHIPSLLGAHHNAWIMRSREWPKLCYWGLLESKGDEVREDGSNRVGIYRLTELGSRFVVGAARVPKYIYLFNNRILASRSCNETVNIGEAIGSKFNYEELMRGI